MTKIYITDLASYNNGFLIGEWVELPTSEEELKNKIEKILRNGEKICKDEKGSHEEYFITDYDIESGEINNNILEIEEYSCVYKINEKCEELENYNDDEIKKISYLIDNLNQSFEEAIENYEEVIIYENMTFRQLAEDYIYDNYNMDGIPEIIKNNIDFKGIAIDLENDGYYEEIGNDIYFYVN